MITVRFPSGFSVQYNDANYCQSEASEWTLRTAKDGGKWVASVAYASGALIEATRPCRTYNPVHDDTVAVLQKEVRRLERALKRLGK